MKTVQTALVLSLALGSLPPPGEAFSITADATALSADSFNVDFLASLPTSAVQTLELAEGFHFFGAPASTNPFLFEVTSDGLLDYDDSLDGFLSGRGTDNLVVRGFPITFNATALSSSNFNLLSSSSLLGSTGTPVVLTLLPGPYTFHAPASSSFNFFSFDVGLDGKLDFDMSLDAFLSGRGTDNLVVLGFPITFNATALSASTFNLLSSSSLQGSTATPTALTLLPGAYTFHAPASSSFSFFSFDVGVDGKLEFDVSLDAFLSGRGTDTLVVHGFPIDIDATALSAEFFNIDFGSAFSTVAITQLRFLPGTHSFHAPASSNSFFFAITPEGLLEFDGTLDGFVSGRGTDTLVVTGFPITFDATALGSGFFVIQSGAAGVGETETLTALSLLPGNHRFQEFPTGVAFDFMVSLAGTVDYGMSLDDVLLGRGTSLLVVLGKPGTQPGVNEVLEDLIAATDLLDAPMEDGLLAILDQIEDAIARGQTQKALALLGSFQTIVSNAIASGNLDPVGGQLLLLRAEKVAELISM